MPPHEYVRSSAPAYPPECVFQPNPAIHSAARPSSCSKTLASWQTKLFERSFKFLFPQKRVRTRVRLRHPFLPLFFRHAGALSVDPHEVKRLDETEHPYAERQTVRARRLQQRKLPLPRQNRKRNWLKQKKDTTDGNHN